MPAPCGGSGDRSASFGGAGLVDCRSACATDFAEAFAILRGFCTDGFSDGFFLESIFGVDGSPDSLDADAVRAAFGFGASAGGGAESVEGRMGGIAAIDALSGLTVSGAAVGTAVFGA